MFRIISIMALNYRYNNGYTITCFWHDIFETQVVKLILLMAVGCRKAVLSALIQNIDPRFWKVKATSIDLSILIRLISDLIEMIVFLIDIRTGLIFSLESCIALHIYM